MICQFLLHHSSKKINGNCFKETQLPNDCNYFKKSSINRIKDSLYQLTKTKISYEVFNECLKNIISIPLFLKKQKFSISTSLLSSNYNQYSTYIKTKNKDITSLVKLE